MSRSLDAAATPAAAGATTVHIAGIVRDTTPLPEITTEPCLEHHGLGGDRAGELDDLVAGFGLAIRTSTPSFPHRSAKSRRC
jgi:hypothetical protein